MTLSDKYLSTALKVQLHIVGPPQVRDTIVATLHYQMVYRVQNHALDIMLPHSSNDALLITVDSHHLPSCVHIPKQISRDQFIQLLPETWITNYEKLHQHQEPIQSSEPTFTRTKDGSVEIKFKHEKSSPPREFQMQFMITSWDQDNFPIHCFSTDGSLVYFFKDPENNHCP